MNFHFRKCFLIVVSIPKTNFFFQKISKNSNSALKRVGKKSDFLSFSKSLSKGNCFEKKIRVLSKIFAFACVHVF